MNDPYLAATALQAVLTQANDNSRSQFLAHFSTEIEELAKALSQAHRRFVLINSRVPQDERSGLTQAFLYSAFDALVSATHLLIFGHLLAAGNLMRNWGESVAMALLCSNDRLSDFELFARDPSKYATHKAIDRLGNRKVAKFLDVNPEGLAVFKEINGFYNEHSHASAWAISARGIQDASGNLTLAGEFDPGKLDYYRHQLSLRRSACDRLFEIMVIAEQNLTNRS
jgi:hypothetical protein